MPKEEYLNGFTEKFFGLLPERLAAAERFYVKNKSLLISDFQACFLEAADTIKSDEKPNIFYKFLRTAAMLHKKVEYQIEAYGQDSAVIFKDKWYRLDWVLNEFIELAQGAEKLQKTYVNRVSKLDLLSLLHQNIGSFLSYALLLARQSLIGLEAERMEGISCVVLGDYFSLPHEDFQTRYVFRNPLLAGVTLEKWLDKSGRDQSCCFFKEAGLGAGKYDSYDFSFARFEACEGVGAQFMDADFTGGKIAKSDFGNANFSKTDIKGADFSGSDFRGAVFDFSSAWEDEGGGSIGHTSFEKANLKGASFRETDLRYANFAGAAIENTSFAGAKLEHAVFAEEDKGNLDLTREQMMAIQFI